MVSKKSHEWWEYDEVAFALPESEWERLVSQFNNTQKFFCDEPENAIDSYDELIRYEPKGLHDGVEKKWVIVHWDQLYFNPHFNTPTSVLIMLDYMDHQSGPYEFVRIGRNLEADFNAIRFNAGDAVLFAKDVIDNPHILIKLN